MPIRLKSLCHTPLRWERHAIVALCLPCDQLQAALQQLLPCCALGLAPLLARVVSNICFKPKSCGMAVRALSENDKAEIKPVDFFLFDITGGVFEYQITEPMGPNTTHSKVPPAAPSTPLTPHGCTPAAFLRQCQVKLPLVLICSFRNTNWALLVEARLLSWLWL